MATKRMPRYDVRNDGAGPYPIFYCDRCGRRFRGQPVVEPTILRDIEPQSARGLLHDAPLAGGALADNVSEDPRYSHEMTRPQLQAAWRQMAGRFHRCPVCGQTVCSSCFDVQTGRCNACASPAGGAASARAS